MKGKTVKKQVLVSLILAGSLVSSFAHAEENTEATQTANSSSVKVTDVQKKDEQVKDIDSEITNAKMRAEMGSKSKWSVKADLTYTGGTAEKAFAAERPNIGASTNTDVKTSLGGTVAVAYRATERDSLRFGTGVSLSTPFQNTLDDAKNSDGARKSSISNPYLEWSRGFKTGSVQNAFDMSWTQFTQPVYTDVYNLVGSLDVNHTLMFDIANSNWQPGLNIDLNYSFYKKTNDGDNDYSVGLYPMVEYAFNDRYSFRTVFRPFIFDHTRSEKATTLEREVYTQSMGLGIAITRDIYLYPNVQFAPEHLSKDNTNVALSSTLNIF